MRGLAGMICRRIDLFLDKEFSSMINFWTDPAMIAIGFVLLIPAWFTIEYIRSKYRGG